MNELEPCPICGSDCKIVAARSIKSEKFDGFVIYCDNEKCFMVVEVYDYNNKNLKQEMIDWWNRRLK